MILFLLNPDRYTTVATSKLNIRDETDSRIASNQILIGQNLFLCKNNTIQNDDGSYVIMDMVVDDLNKMVNLINSKTESLLVEQAAIKMGNTVFVIDFSLASEATFPRSDDVFP